MSANNGLMMFKGAGQKPLVMTGGRLCELQSKEKVQVMGGQEYFKCISPSPCEFKKNGGERNYCAIAIAPSSEPIAKN